MAYFIEDSKATVILEEWRSGDSKTVGKSIADSQCLVWHNVGTPVQDIYKTYNPYPIWIGNECMGTQPYGPIDVQIRREEYFLAGIEDAMRDHEVGAFICGLAHLHSMAEKLYRLGYLVEGHSCLE